MSQRAGEGEMPIDEIFYLKAELFSKCRSDCQMLNFLLIDELKINSGDQWCRLANLRPPTAE